MKTILHLKHFIIVSILLLTALTGCLGGNRNNVVPVKGELADKIAEEAQPIAENILIGLNDNDYATFSLDFDAMMKKGLDEKSFNTMKTTFDEKIGKFVSMEVEKVEKVEESYYAITYRARFEKEDGVTFRMTINQNDPPEVAGVWFTSPKLRSK